jgi:hypothetical protein
VFALGAVAPLDVYEKAAELTSAGEWSSREINAVGMPNEAERFFP